MHFLDRIPTRYLLAVALAALVALVALPPAH